jgi:hypothetical protein
LTINDGNKNYDFTCAGVLDKKNKLMILSRVPTLPYEFTLTASTEASKQSKDPIFVAVKGVKGMTEFQVKNYKFSYWPMTEWELNPFKRL